MKPGDMVLYESHSVLHGRPFPMNGSHYANVFVHYEPLDHAENNAKVAAKKNANMPINFMDADKDYMKNKMKRKLNHAHTGEEDHLDHSIGGHERHNHDYETIRRHMDQIDKESDAVNNPHQSPSFRLRKAAQKGDINAIEDLLSENPVKQLVNTMDEHQWQVSHQGADIQ
jgi:prolyl 4-hydroxylase